jgi:hypothetical protein
MNEIAKDDGRELSQAEKLAKAEEFKAKYAKGELADGTIVKLNTRVEPDRKAEMEDRLAKIAALRKIGWDREEEARAQWLKRREREKAEELVEEVAKAEEGPKAERKTDGAGPNFTFKDAEADGAAFKEAPKEEPKADPDEEAVKEEAPSAVSGLGMAEAKRRYILRRLKLEEINREYAVIRSVGGKCAVSTMVQSKRDPSKKTFSFQTKESFTQWMENQLIPSLREKGAEKECAGPWWWRHSKRRQTKRYLSHWPRRSFAQVENSL